MILLALDYTKAFDSMDFQFIFESFKTYGFGEKFQMWIKTLYNGGKRCITNNGNLSEIFSIERSTRQGDPISPIVFILGLELLLVSIRSDYNIKGIKIENNELKMTTYADNVSYFMKDDTSAMMFLEKIEAFSKVSGLAVNRSKSECLLLSFEIEISSNSEFFLGGKSENTGPLS